MIKTSPDVSCATAAAAWLTALTAIDTPQEISIDPGRPAETWETPPP